MSRAVGSEELPDAVAIISRPYKARTTSSISRRTFTASDARVSQGVAQRLLSQLALLSDMSPLHAWTRDRTGPANASISRAAIDLDLLVLDQTSVDTTRKCMPRRPRILDTSNPIHAFALELRQLRDRVVHRPIGRHGDEGKQHLPLTVDELSARYDVSRASIYSALSGQRLPSRATLLAIVRAWAPNPEEDLAYWMTRRSEVEASFVSQGHAQAGPAPVAPRDGLPDQNHRTPSRTRGQAPERRAGGKAEDYPELALLRLGSLLQRSRKQQGLNVKQVAYACGCSYSTVSAVLRGFSAPSDSLLSKMLDVLHISEDEAALSRRLLEASRDAEQVYLRYAETRNDEMIEQYLIEGQHDDRFWRHPDTW